MSLSKHAAKIVRIFETTKDLGKKLRDDESRVRGKRDESTDETNRLCGGNTSFSRSGVTAGGRSSYDERPLNVRRTGARCTEGERSPHLLVRTVSCFFVSYQHTSSAKKNKNY